MGNIIGIPFDKVFEGVFGFSPYGWFSNDRTPHAGVILLGNTGVGKSFLANILLNENYFQHECNPSSVTHVTEWKRIRANNRSYVVFNVPGLVEHNQSAVEKNKLQIQRAFEEMPYSIVAPVFIGGSSGRLREEDILAFNALNQAYHFEQESLLFIINDLPPSRPPFYEGQMMVKLEELFNVKDIKVCFVNRIDADSFLQRRKLRGQLFNGLNLCTPMKHTKHGEVVLLVNRIKELQEELKHRQDALDERLKMLEGIILQQQAKFEAVFESDTCTIL